ncbi:MAG: hypothetical protein AVDCRST_MAG01-01-1799, partial [uncultured Rubrobacteraceae bacterium]
AVVNLRYTPANDRCQRLARTPSHPSAWKDHSPNFARRGFCEVRMPKLSSSARGAAPL